MPSFSTDHKNGFGNGSFAAGGFDQGSASPATPGAAVGGFVSIDEPFVVPVVSVDDPVSLFAGSDFLHPMPNAVTNVTISSARFMRLL